MKQREGREVWEQRVRQLAESGLTPVQFAAELGVNVNTLNGWRWKLSAEARRAPRASPLLAVPPVVEVKLSTREAESSNGAQQAVPFEVVLPSGEVVRVPPQFDGVALRSLVRALEAR